MSMVVPVSSVICRMTAPPLPMTSRIFSGSIFMVMIEGAHSDIFSRGVESTFSISPRMCRRPAFACSRAIFMISGVMPSTLMSICSVVTPSLVPATLKSMSPR